MSAEPTPSWRPEPEPQNELERLILRSEKDPSVNGRIFRLLWETELHTFLPDHPEMHGTHEIKNGDNFPILLFTQEKETFAAVFASEEAADYAANFLPKPKPAIASVLGEVIFRVLNDGKTVVRINGKNRVRLILQPEAVTRLVRGELTHYRGDDAVLEKVDVLPVPAEKLPSKLREGIRVFCAKRRVPIGVYVFHPQDKATGEWKENALNIILWLRSTDNDFYNDFLLLVSKLNNDRFELKTAVATAEDESSLAYLQTCTPLWPIVKGA